MADKNLGDDMVKLVRYTVVNIERGHYAIVASGHELFDENMSGDAFASWVISQNAQAIAEFAEANQQDPLVLFLTAEALEKAGKAEEAHEHCDGTLANDCPGSLSISSGVIGPGQRGMVLSSLSSTTDGADGLSVRFVVFALGVSGMLVAVGRQTRRSESNRQ